ncbi:Dolichyl-phosphate-mannose-protein mannosyltransferase-domain-containing protein [Umbelopsis sp. AD052]|nr:Dolichyl-phosphate-mannose-protein mannosyltransferase-domain-containing protein [Umbelopsis sp. AD052]
MDSRVRNYQGDHNITIGSDSPSDAEGPYYTQSYSSANEKYDSFRQRRRDVNRHNGQYKHYNEDLGLGVDYDNSYVKAARKRTALEDQSRKRDLKIAAALTVWACYIRLWKIWQPASVVFDEVHFGGFASKYIRTRFFMDVHPPLAKMLIALAAKLAGFDGGFDFKDIGKDYLEPGVPYVPIRLFCGFCGLLVVPVAYMTIRGSGHSIAAALLAAFFVCYENGLIANNRLILLDPPLLFFTSATVLMWVNFHNQKNRPFQFWWWTWLAMTGVGLGLTVSCKWVGLFTIATVGCSTIKGLLDIWANVRIPIHEFLRHFMARAVCLIILPLAIYMLMFEIHFISLPNTGEGDGFMSPEFQQTLSGHAMVDSPVDIAYGSKVYIRHIETHGGYLHSHPHNYPTGSKQQQLTLYPHKDDNNWWTITKQYGSNPTEIEWVQNGDIVRIEHTSTNKRLHSHDVRPPMTDVEYHNEVSCYGTNELDFQGDANDFWRVQILDHDKRDPEAQHRLRTLNSKFQLVHVNTNCALFSHGVKLPEWGYGQQEVTCIKDGKKPKTMWYIESSENENLPEDTELVNYRKPGFFSKFAELNQVMWNTNKGLTDSHPYDSRPQVSQYVLIIDCFGGY